MDLWELNKFSDEYKGNKVRHGLRCRYSTGIDEGLKQIIMNFAEWIRDRFSFPMRVVVYFKAEEHIIARDKEKVDGIFCGPYDPMLEPYIKIACGKYSDSLNQKEAAFEITSILTSLAHEITHYYQWLNRLELSYRREEYQATWYSHRIVDEYMYDVINEKDSCPELKSIINGIIEFC